MRHVVKARAGENRLGDATRSQRASTIAGQADVAFVDLRAADWPRQGFDRRPPTDGIS